MNKSQRNFIIALVAIAATLFLYLVRSTLMPFVLAAVFAYLLNPLISFLTHRVRIPRSLSIIAIYIILIGALGITLGVVGSNLASESEQFARETRVIMKEANSTISTLPSWLQPIVLDSFESVRTSLLYPQKRITAFLPGAVNRTINMLIFLVASFYFLRDGGTFIKSFFAFLSKKTAAEVETILQKINAVLGSYLRGQLFLVAIMSTLTYVGLTIIGVRYALIISVFTGFAEIIPYVGPIVAAAVAMIVAFTDQISRFNLLPTIDLVTVAVLYFVLRQAEDLFIIPVVLGRLTKLHPLIIMFVVLAGGHVFGLFGFIAAVPVVASLKVVIEHLHSLWTKNQ